ncbi:MAG: hypothetical protein ACWGP1_16350 [Syntrophobacteria bacterium]|jgi:hypothetical protein
MRGWAIKLLVVILCLGLALPALVAADEPVTSKYNVKIWGRVKFDIHYDTAQFVNYNDFLGAPADSQATANASNNSTDFNPRDTRLGFSASHSADAWVGKAVVEMDFYGTNSGNNLIPRMRLGYIDLANNDSGTSIRAGQDWIPIMSSNPSTIDFGILSASGNLWWRVPQVTFRQNLEGLELLAGVMLHRRTDTASETKLPWIMGRVAYSFEAFDGKHMVAANGGYQADKVKNSTGDDDDIDRWLVGGEAKFNLGPVLLKGEIWYGEGIGSHFLRYDLDVYDTDSTAATSFDEWQAWGGWIDATYKIMPEWSVTAGLGVDDPDDGDYNRQTGNLNRKFKENRTYFVNTWYSLTQAIKVGAEFMYLEADREKDTGANFKDKGTRTTISMFYAF